jgi:hypothetical protein
MASHWLLARAAQAQFGFPHLRQFSVTDPAGSPRWR